jgi:hypothetical protein
MPPPGGSVRGILKDEQILQSCIRLAKNRIQSVVQFPQVGQEQVGAKPEVKHPCVSKAGDHTFDRTTMESKYSKARDF